MRLGQIKRLHNIETAKIVSFYKKQGVEISDHPNSKLTDEQLDEVLKNLKPIEEKVEEVVKEPTSTEEKPKKTTKKAVKKEEPEIGEVIEVKKEKKTPKKAKKETPRVFTALGEDENADAEVIRAPKQELEGIKVLGKIDLPEPVIEEKEEAIAETETSIEDKQPAETEDDPLSDLHPSKKAKLKAKEKLEEIEKKKFVAKKAEKRKKEKSIAQKVAEEKSRSVRKKKKANPHKHIKKAGLQAQRIEISEDGTVLPRREQEEKPVVKKQGLFARIWKWFNT